MRLRVRQYCPGVSESYARDHEPWKTGPWACATRRGVGGGWRPPTRTVGGRALKEPTEQAWDQPPTRCTVGIGVKRQVVAVRTEAAATPRKQVAVAAGIPGPSRTVWHPRSRAAESAGGAGVRTWCGRPPPRSAPQTADQVSQADRPRHSPLASCLTEVRASPRLSRVLPLRLFDLMEQAQRETRLRRGDARTSVKHNARASGAGRSACET